MNFVISIVNPEARTAMREIYKDLGLQIAVDIPGKGTAQPSMLELLGIESIEKRMFVTVADREKTKELLSLHRKRLFTGVPGHGIVISVPVKSVGGGKTLAYLSQNKIPEKRTPEISPAYELVVIIGNEGCTDTVMNAARSAGATGGTVIHGKGTGSSAGEKFYNVSIAKEKEVILVVAQSERKAEIMRAVLEKAGPETPSGAIIFSLPVNETAGFGMFE